MTPKTIEEALLDPDIIIGLANKLKEERALTQKQRQIIGELKPKADYTDSILKKQRLGHNNPNRKRLWDEWPSKEQKAA